MIDFKGGREKGCFLPETINLTPFKPLKVHIKSPLIISVDVLPL